MTARKKPEIDIDVIPPELYPALFLTLNDAGMAEAIRTFTQTMPVAPEAWEDYIVLAIERRDNMGGARIAMQDFVRKALEKYGVWKEGENIVQQGEWPQVVEAISHLLDAKYGVYAERAAILFISAVFKDGVQAVKDGALEYYMGRPPVDIKISPEEHEAVRKALQAIAGMRALLYAYEQGWVTTLEQQKRIEEAVDEIFADPKGYALGTILSPGEEGHRQNLLDIALG